MPMQATPAIKRLMGKIEILPWSGCWIYMGALNQSGYGWIGVTEPKRYVERAHRVTYKHFKGAIPDGLEIDHLCRVRSCCNPDHLEAVTRKENCKRGECGMATGKRNREKTHCIRGHEFDDENTQTNSNGSRTCKACARIRGSKYRSQQ